MAKPKIGVPLPDAETNQARDRQWSLVMLRGGDEVLLRHCLVLADDEEIDDTPPEVRMSETDWKRRHKDFGLDRAGAPL